MRKIDLIRENQRLELKVKTLEQDIAGYKYILETTRDCYGLKLLELENERLQKLHPNLIAVEIEWSSVEDRLYDPKKARYKFRYEIKGEY